jgi:hypothetical protein
LRLILFDALEKTFTHREKAIEAEEKNGDSAANNAIDLFRGILMVLSLSFLA